MTSFQRVREIADEDNTGLRGQAVIQIRVEPCPMTSWHTARFQLVKKNAVNYAVESLRGVKKDTERVFLALNAIHNPTIEIKYRVLRRQSNSEAKLFF
ncbi:hypothetical protein J6590_050062 [Homalodisca vitripennis]|nr:hypothetical protein J6590_050062 [Homalodisca vitripennis]